MLSICVVAQQYGQVISGTGLYARNLIASLVEAGHHVTVVAPEDQRPEREPDFRFVGVPAPWFSQTQARWISLSKSFSRTLVALQRRERFDLVHFTDARESLFFRSSVTTIGNVHDTYAAGVRSPAYYRERYVDWFQRWLYYRFVRLCEARALPRLDRIVGNSKHTAKKLTAEYGISPEELRVCYVCIEPSEYLSNREVHAWDTSRPPRVLFVGGNMQRKGLPTLILAASDIVRALPTTEFWVVGRDRAVPHMQELCRANGVETHFHFLGWRSHSEVVQMYAEADVFVMPSLEEALGVTFLEAMASGVPSIGTRVGGIPELIDHGHNGLLIDPEEPRALAEALVRLLKSQDLQLRIVEGGFETVERFTVEDMMRCTHQVYEELTAS